MFKNELNNMLERFALLYGIYDYIFFREPFNEIQESKVHASYQAMSQLICILMHFISEN